MSNQEPPWGRKKKPQTPEEMVAQIIKKLQDFFSEGNKSPDGGGSGDEPAQPSSPFAGIAKILAIVGIVILFQGIYYSFFKIAPSEVGVVLRLGEYSRTVDPGLRFMIPFVEELYKVDVIEPRRQTFGVRAGASNFQSARESKSDNMESLMLTADKNVINVAWIVRYRISDPLDYLFKIRDVDQAIHDLSESVTRRIVGNMDFDFVLSNRDLLASIVRNELQEQLDYLESGVMLAEVQFQDINPPDRVKPAFNEVNEADQDMVRLVNEAEEQYNKVIPAARGNALQILEQARGYAIERVNNAVGETSRFLDILERYTDTPDVTRQRMYIETMEQVLPTVENIYVMDKDQQGPLPLLNLGQKGANPVNSQ